MVDRHRHQPLSAPATELIGRDTCAASLIEHACRQVLRLQVLRAKETITILRILLDAIKHCGKPKAIRIDNEAIYTPWAFAFALRWLGMRHQTKNMTETSREQQPPHPGRKRAGRWRSEQRRETGMQPLRIETPGFGRAFSFPGITTRADTGMALVSVRHLIGISSTTVIPSRRRESCFSVKLSGEQAPVICDRNGIRPTIERR